MKILVQEANDLINKCEELLSQGMKSDLSASTSQSDLYPYSNKISIQHWRNLS